MKQLNLNLSPEFEKDLKAYMRAKGFKEKSAAIRDAVKNSVERLRRRESSRGFRSWLGKGLKVPPRLNRKFKDEDELWS